MICPYCSTEMTSGFIQGMGYKPDLAWFDDNPKLIDKIVPAGEQLTKHHFSGGKLTGHKCSKCKKIIISL